MARVEHESCLRKLEEFFETATDVGFPKKSKREILKRRVSCHLGCPTASVNEEQLTQTFLNSMQLARSNLKAVYSSQAHPWLLPRAWT